MIFCGIPINFQSENENVTLYFILGLKKNVCHATVVNVYRVFILFLLTLAKNSRCSLTVNESKRTSCCGHRPRVLLTFAMSALMSNPFTSAVPLVGGMNPFQ